MVRTMCEILFRGEDVETGAWVKGFYVCLNGNEHRIYSGYAETDCGDYYPDWFKVDPDTVGEFTGLYNAAGQMIFDGDIVKFNEKKYVVQREDETPGGSWSCTAYILQEVGVDGGLSFEDTIDEYCNEICVEIIGNIHDNPELLEGGAVDG